MDKKQLLDEISKLSSNSNITKQELLDAFDQGTANPGFWHGNVQEPQIPVKKTEISDILYYIGGGIVFAGIGVLVYGSWDNLSLFMRILVTLGFGAIAYLVAALISRSAKHGNLSFAFFLISALLLPIGCFVTLATAGFETFRAGPQSIISFMLFLIFMFSYVAFKRTLFIVFSVVFGTWLFFSFTNWLIGGNPLFSDNFDLYRILVAGLSYILLGFYFSTKQELSNLKGWMYGMGSLAFLGSALGLGGWSPAQNYFWEIIYPGLIFGLLFLSIKAQAKQFLVWGSIFLMAYIMKLTGEYFSEGFGWPIALVLAGLMLIGVGYYAFYFSKKYLANSASIKPIIN